MSDQKPTRGETTPSTPQEILIMLMDPDLLQLPLEALQSLQSESIIAMSRDISLQILHHKAVVPELGM